MRREEYLPYVRIPAPQLVGFVDAFPNKEVFAIKPD